jgi:hypothetical protein
MYALLTAALDGASAEPPLHAEQIASAATAPAYLTKPVVFITLLLQSRNDFPVIFSTKTAPFRAAFVDACALTCGALTLGLSA